MCNISHLLRQVALISIVGVLLLVLSACGPNASSTTTGSGPGNTTGTQAPHPTPTPTATTTGGYGSIHGCPSDTVVSTAPKQANVIIQDKDINSTVTAHIGDIIEVRLPFGQKWSGPASIPSNLQQQQPAGYAFTPDNVCIWRFVAQSAGLARLDFYMRALCLKGMMCPMFIVDDSFNIDVK
jgi:hypothetical protein